MYQENDIFLEDGEYSARAKFCNENGLTIKKLDIDENGNQRYIITNPDPLSQDMIINMEIEELKTWFNWYDEQVAQYNRCQRMGEPFDKDINELDAQAQIRQQRIRDLKAQLG